MKLLKLNRILFLIAFGAGSINSSVVSASSDKYHCQEVNGVYSVYSRVTRGDIKLMDFNRDVNQKWSAASRCEEVAIRLQRYYDNGNLKYVGADNLNNQPVLCAVAEQDQPCSNDNLVVTLPPNTDPVASARSLMNTREVALGRVITVSGDKKIEVTTDDGNTYYDLEALEQAILSKGNSDRFIPADN